MQHQHGPQADEQAAIRSYDEALTMGVCWPVAAHIATREAREGDLSEPIAGQQTVLVARVVFTFLYLALTGVPTRLRRWLKPGDTGRPGYPRADDDRGTRMPRPAHIMPSVRHSQPAARCLP